MSLAGEVNTGHIRQARPWVEGSQTDCRTQTSLESGSETSRGQALGKITHLSEPSSLSWDHHLRLSLSVAKCIRCKALRRAQPRQVPGYSGCGLSKSSVRSWGGF